MWSCADSLDLDKESRRDSATHILWLLHLYINVFEDISQSKCISGDISQLQPISYNISQSEPVFGDISSSEPIFEATSQSKSLKFTPHTWKWPHSMVSRHDDNTIKVTNHMKTYPARIHHSCLRSQWCNSSSSGRILGFHSGAWQIPTKMWKMDKITSVKGRMRMQENMGY